MVYCSIPVICTFRVFKIVLFPPWKYLLLIFWKWALEIQFSNWKKVSVCCTYTCNFRLLSDLAKGWRKYQSEEFRMFRVFRGSSVNVNIDILIPISFLYVTKQKGKEEDFWKRKTSKTLRYNIETVSLTLTIAPRKHYLKTSQILCYLYIDTFQLFLAFTRISVIETRLRFEKWYANIPNPPKIPWYDICLHA